MNARYFGKQIEKDELGHVTARFKPCVTLTYKKRESALAEKIVAYIEKETGITGDGFGNDDTIEVDFYVNDREDGESVLAAYRDAKKIYRRK
ncbi:MAG: hypothetical protein HDT20_05400 [Oscillibacter sp.]|nr:hypothetical protein [Oscillibacter sp.]